MSPVLHHECTRIPVTALVSCGALLIAAEGPFIRFYHAQDTRYISSKRIFKSQAVHGLCVCPERHGRVTKVVVWGGRLVRALDIDFPAPDDQHDVLTVYLSDVAKTPDWILDLAARPAGLENGLECQKDTCVAVTAHNALLQLSTERRDADEGLNNSYFSIVVSELTSSSRSILYSAHLLWESSTRVLIAAGTAFGEIMYWSWSHDPGIEPYSRVHRVFLGHEGSIFGVQISQTLPSGCLQQLSRVIASCSDDRTIRIWDVSDVKTTATTTEESGDEAQVVRTRHTGFSNESFDANSFSSSDCLATGWGHTSRVWTVRFLDTSLCDGSLFLLSAGEDATSRTWELIPNNKVAKEFPYELLHLDCAANHNGKNLWSTTLCHDLAGSLQVVCGAADSQITAHPLFRTMHNTKISTKDVTLEYTLHDVLSLARPAVRQPNTVASIDGRKSSSKADFFRSYCFVDEHSILLTTNSGKVLLGFLSFNTALDQSGVFHHTIFVAQLEDLSGYSVCASGALPGMAFVAGARGNIYVYSHTRDDLTKIHFLNGKVGEMHTASFSTSTGEEVVALLITVVGQKQAQLLYVDTAQVAHVFYTAIIPISDGQTGYSVTSMAHVRASSGNFLFLGFRRGSIAVYGVNEDAPDMGQATLFRLIENAHNGESVTHLAWNTSETYSSHGHTLSVGRDGRLVVHHVDLSRNTIQLVHSLTLPIGQNMEGLYFHDGHLFVHGFSSKKWVLYDVTTEEEVMSVETGGAHRNWAFRPHSSSQGGTLVWTRASAMHIHSQIGPNHVVIRSGGHGREIKAVAISPVTDRGSPSRLIATGAEDTDIKMFEYIEGELICRKTVRKHTTGIQHLQWSENGDYLFSSGGCEEFYIWRIREQPSFLSVGIVCEHVYAPESEHSDLRIMSFDVTRHDSGYTIAMVFSDSSMKVYCYIPEATVKWQPLVRGTYFTSCLTQCIFLSPRRILTAGTDGHAVVWPLSPETNRPTLDSASSASTLSWQHPARIHQNSSKTMMSHVLSNGTTFIASGGDDGSLAFVLASTISAHSSTSPEAPYASPPVLVYRAHASAVTAMAIIPHYSRIFLLTSGNDEWVRLWEVTVQDIKVGGPVSQDGGETEDRLVVKRHKKIKTHVADVSSMAVVASTEGSLDARVLLCGVGMEVIRVAWEAGC